MPTLSALILALLLQGCGAPTPLDAKTNILVLSLDTVRADHLGAYGANPSPTPNLDRFASEAVVFENAYSTIGETLFSHASLLTSRYPSELSTLDYGFAFPDEVPTLPEVLQIYGYETGAVTAGGHLSAFFGFDRGFDHFVSPRHWASLYDTLPPAMNWLDQRESSSPFFLLLHSYDAHSRYLKPTPYGFAFADLDYRGTGYLVATRPSGVTRTLFGRFYPNTVLPDLLDWTEPRLFGPRNRVKLAVLSNRADAKSRKVNATDTAYLRGIYDGALAYADAMFGVMMAELERRGRLDDTIIIVLSDHGEELGERGVFNHRFTLTEEVLHVPLMVRLPGGGGGTRVSDWVSLLDLMPTLLEMVGAQAPAISRGRSFLAALNGQPIVGHDKLFAENVFRVMSVKSKQGRLTFSGIGADSPFAADVMATARLDGPAFAWSEGLKDPDTAEQLRVDLAQWKGDLPPAAKVEREVSEALRTLLREQGYWGPM